MSDLDLATLRKQCITSLYLCTDNVSKYLEAEKETEFNKLKGYVEEYCLLEAQQDVAFQALEKAKNETDASNVQSLDARFAEHLSGMANKRLNVRNHPYMLELDKRIKKGLQNARPNLDESDLAITESQERYVDPITKKPIEDPVKNSLCGHIYERQTIMELINKKNRVRCPVAGCGNREALQPQHLLCDEELRFRVALTLHSTAVGEQSIMDLDTTESKESTTKKISRIQDEKQSPGTSKDTCSDVYKELINLEKEAIVPNSEPFECEVCMEACGRGDGVVLRECIHIFCKRCVADAIKHCQEPIVACPAFNCLGTLQEREIRALLNLDEYERWLARGLVTAESGMRNTFHCRTADCNGWAFCEQGVRRFPCPVCKHTNCIPCQAIHEGDTCEEYKDKLKKAVSLAEKNQLDDETRSFLDSLIQRGEALACPECNIIITKKLGCDWIKCSACKTEICWVTKGRRWGPGGTGDTSGGCRCRINGKRCHPTCNNCH